LQIPSGDDEDDRSSNDFSLMREEAGCWSCLLPAEPEAREQPLLPGGERKMGAVAGFRVGCVKRCIGLRKAMNNIGILNFLAKLLASRTFLLALVMGCICFYGYFTHGIEVFVASSLPQKVPKGSPPGTAAPPVVEQWKPYFTVWVRREEFETFKYQKF
jgi:hypothetical protein